MTGLHCDTVQTLKQRFVTISKAALPCGEESLKVQSKVKAGNVPRKRVWPTSHNTAQSREHIYRV